MTFRLMTYNIRHGGTGRVQAIASVINACSPDLVVLQEATRPENVELYRKYEALAAATPNVHFVGRLATYRYYNMDQVVAQALTLYAKLTGLPAAPTARAARPCPRAPASIPGIPGICGST